MTTADGALASVVDWSHPAGCWIAPSHERGYTHNHRTVYEALIGPIPAGLVIDHLCRERACLNPLHMEPVTIAENNRRGLVVEPRPTCRRGHEWTPAITYVRPDGSRTCRRCRWLRDHGRDWSRHD